jgi:hypothetical protein
MSLAMRVKIGGITRPLDAELASDTSEDEKSEICGMSSRSEGHPRGGPKKRKNEPEK